MKKLVLLLIVALLALTSCSTNVGAYCSKKCSVGAYSVTTPISDRNKVNGEKVQMNTTLATVLMADGKIVNVDIDTAQTTVNIDAAGKVTLPAETPSKKEKKDAYGMKDASTIGKEWFEQIAALEENLVGKTLDEVKGFELTDEQTVADADLASSVSITVNTYLEAVAKAMENAKEVEGEIAKIGSAVNTGLQDKAPADDKDGTVTFNTNYGFVALDAEDKVVAAFVDVAQNRVNYNAKGEWADFTPLESKKVLKDDYGMKDASAANGIGKEWYEQAEALENWMLGKTVAEITGVATDESGVPTDDALTSTVTVKINDYKAVIEKAAANAVEVK